MLKKCSISLVKVIELGRVYQEPQVPKELLAKLDVQGTKVDVEILVP